MIEDHLRLAIHAAESILGRIDAPIEARCNALHRLHDAVANLWREALEKKEQSRKQEWSSVLDQMLHEALAG